MNKCISVETILRSKEYCKRRTAEKKLGKMKSQCREELQQCKEYIVELQERLCWSSKECGVER